MSLEARVQLLEDKFEALDHAFRENNTIFEATHGVACLILNDQRETRKEQFEMKRQIESLEKRLDKRIDGLEQKFDKRIDELELLIRQYFTQG